MDINAIITLDEDELFEFANDTEQSMLCDWREAPDGVVEYANAFLPDNLTLAYSEDESGFSFSNDNGCYSVSFDDYQGIEEPIPILVREINRLISPSHEARYFNCLEGTDSYSYLLRPIDFWSTLDSEHSDDAIRIFQAP